MAEFTQSAEQSIDANESVVFVNNTDSSFEVGAGIIFRKSGLYEVSVVGNRITVTKVSDLIREALKQELCEDVPDINIGDKAESEVQNVDNSISFSKETNNFISCLKCVNFSKEDNYCKLLQINWLPDNFGCNNGKEKGRNE